MAVVHRAAPGSGERRDLWTIGMAVEWLTAAETPAMLL
jgi:hypothetical protein